MSEFKAPSGAKFKINPANFKDAMALKSAIAKEISSANVSFDIDLSKGANQDIDAMDFAKLVAVVDASDRVNECLFKCLIRCTYNGEKITHATFEPVEAREDYYEIVFACLKENIAPFFKGLISKLSPFMARDQTKEKSQK